jgi:choline dehydrogenase-like flavoprotein
VTNITWANSTNLPLVAAGVEFAPSGGGSFRHTVSARREVILAAGAIQIPSLVQLFCIGDSSTLAAIGITTRIDLKTVGRNLQEQV